MDNDEFNFSNTSHGAVIIFPDGMTKAQCEDILRRMVKAGYCKESAYTRKPPAVHEFNPDHGSPVWYIP